MCICFLCSVKNSAEKGELHCRLVLGRHSAQISARTLHRTVEGLKRRGMHNKSLMIVVKGLVKAYPLIIHSFITPSRQMKGKYFK
jgi:hypothetical protein